MSVVTLQVGQCGNQIGGQLFATIMDDLKNGDGAHLEKSINTAYSDTSLERFFYQETKDNLLNARAVMVDMEPKVIAHTKEIANKSGTWKYPEKQQFCQKKGSGNNWANGFCNHGPSVKSNVMEMVRREVEKCDRFGGFLTLMSLAGGTGSGVGTYLTQCLRDEFPESFIINQVVWPYANGEVIVQNYNAILTMSQLYQTADAILTMENDVLHKICSQLMCMKKVSFSDINRVVSHKLASVLQPVYCGVEESMWKGFPNRNHIGDLLELLVPHPEHKLLVMKNIPQMSENSIRYSSYQWHGLLKHLRQMLVADAPIEEGINWQIKATPSSSDFNKSIANLLILRGKDINQADVSGFQEPHLYPSWMPPGGAFSAWSHPRSFSQYDRSAVLISNSQSPVRILDSVVGKAWNMFASRAYIHQYLKFGMSEGDFMDSFACLEQVISSYKHI